MQSSTAYFGLWAVVFPTRVMTPAVEKKVLLVVSAFDVFHLRTFARKFFNIDFFLRLLPLKVDELLMSEM